jgi:tRNA G46 methylase TrmB
MGDGRFIKDLSEKEKENYFIGIEINTERFQKLRQY